MCCDTESARCVAAIPVPQEQQQWQDWKRNEGIDNLYLEGVSVLPIFWYHEVQQKKSGANLQPMTDQARHSK